MADPDSSKPKTQQRQAFVALVQAAMKKLQAKQPLSGKESRAYDAWEAEEDERRGMRFMSALPKKIYCSIVGRQTKVVNDQADTYGIPLRGATVNLIEVLKWTHDFFAKHKHELPAIVRGDDGGGQSPRDQLVLEQIEVYRRRVQLLENKIDVDNKSLLPRVEVHELLIQLARLLRGAGERLDKQFGPQAASILDIVLDDFDTILSQLETKSEQQAADLVHAAQDHAR